MNSCRRRDSCQPGDNKLSGRQGWRPSSCWVSVGTLRTTARRNATPSSPAGSFHFPAHATRRPASAAPNRSGRQVDGWPFFPAHRHQSGGLKRRQSGGDRSEGPADTRVSASPLSRRRPGLLPAGCVSAGQSARAPPPFGGGGSPWSPSIASESRGEPTLFGRSASPKGSRRPVGRR
jgi:hypothetical protein